MNFLELAKERYSCRRFQERPVEEEKLQKIIEAAIAAPTAVNAQPYRIWVIKSSEAIEKINEVTPYGFGASVIIAVGGKLDQAWVRKSDEKNFADVDAAIVGTHIMLEAQDLGLGSTWVGVMDIPKLQQLFPEMAEYDMVGLFPIGYPSEEKGGQPSKLHYRRRSVEDVVSIL